MKDKKDIKIIMYLKKTFFGECGRRPNKIRVHKDSEFYNRLMKSWL